MFRHAARRRPPRMHTTERRSFDLNVRMATEVMNLQLHKYWASLSPLLPSLIKSLEVPESPQTRISRKYGPKSVRSRFAVQWGKGGNSKCCFAMSGKQNIVLGPVWLGMSEIVFGKRAVGTLRCLERLASYRELQLREASRNKRHTHTICQTPCTYDTRHETCVPIPCLHGFNNEKCRRQRPVHK